MTDKEKSKEKLNPDNTPAQDKKVSISAKGIRELIIGAFLILVGLIIIFDKLLKVSIDGEVVFAIGFFIAGIAFQWSFFKNRQNLLRLYLGDIFLLITIPVVENNISSIFENILVTFVLFQIAATTIMAYSIVRREKIMLISPVICLLLVFINLFWQDFAFVMRNTLILWLISMFFLFIYKIKKSILYPLLSVLFLFGGFDQLGYINEEYIAALILWGLAAMSMIFYLKKPSWLWLLFIGWILIMAGFTSLGLEIGLITGDALGVLWQLWLSGFCFIIWLMKSKYPLARKAIWLAVILLFSSIITAASIYAGSAEAIIAVIFIGLGLFLILRRAFSPRWRTEKR